MSPTYTTSRISRAVFASLAAWWHRPGRVHRRASIAVAGLLIALAAGTIAGAQSTPAPPPAPLAPAAALPPLTPFAPMAPDDSGAVGEAYAAEMEAYAKAVPSVASATLGSDLREAKLADLLNQQGQTPMAADNGDQNGSTLTIALSHPGQPAVLHVGLVNGRITVKAGADKNVIVQDNSGNGLLRSQAVPPEAAGMHRLTMPRGMSATEDNNQVTVTVTGGMNANLTITVPPKTSVSLKNVSGGIDVTGIDGDLEVQTTNGAITLNQVGGSVVANTINGKILATITNLDASKPTAFSSLNGAIDVALPANLKANLYMRSDRGDVYTDFDLKPLPAGTETGGGDNSTPVVAPVPPEPPMPPGQIQTEIRDAMHSQMRIQEDARGMNRVQVDRSVRGAINGGGPQIQFRNFNGNIYIRKAK